MYQFKKNNEFLIAAEIIKYFFLLLITGEKHVCYEL